MTEPPALTSLDPERHPEPVATLGHLHGSPAMPFKLTADQGTLKSAPVPDAYTQGLVQAAKIGAEQFCGLAQLSTENQAGELSSYAVATRDPLTAARLREFVERLQLEDEDDD
jgi:hypothetical protein